MRVTESGLKYSLIKFDDYKIRCRVEIKTADEKHEIDIYTTDENRYSVIDVLFKNKNEGVKSIIITDWHTREEDEDTAKFLIEFLNV